MILFHKSISVCAIPYRQTDRHTDTDWKSQAEMLFAELKMSQIIEIQGQNL